MPDRNLQVLLIDGKTEDSHWVRELLADFGDNRFAGGWMHGIEIFPIDRLADALTLLSNDGAMAFDVILLNPDLPDGMGLHSLLRLQTCAPALPILILAELDDQDLALSMVRAGAQDFLAKSELDSRPLARALRLAVERNKTVCQLQTAAWRDDLTGLANRTGFEILAGRDLATARRLHQSMSCLLFEVEGLRQLAITYGKAEPQLAIIEIADILRACIGDTGALARVDHLRFAASLPALCAASLSTLSSTIRRRLQQYTSSPNRVCLSVRQGSARSIESAPASVDDLLTAAGQSLCENMGIPLHPGLKEAHFSEYACSHRRDL